MTSKTSTPPRVNVELYPEDIVCGDRTSDRPLSDEFPAAVCLLAPGHVGMHTNGSCSWAHPWEEDPMFQTGYDGFIA